MADDNDNKTWIRIARLNPISLRVNNKEEADAYHQAEDLLNTVWGRYETRYRNGRTSSTEIMAMVAFKFAWMYINSERHNEDVDSFLKEFESKLDDIVVKSQQP